MYILKPEYIHLKLYQLPFALFLPQKWASKEKQQHVSNFGEKTADLY